MFPNALLWFVRIMTTLIQSSGPTTAAGRSSCGLEVSAFGKVLKGAIWEALTIVVQELYLQVSHLCEDIKIGLKIESHWSSGFLGGFEAPNAIY